jgi:hypothetical protein
MKIRCEQNSIRLRLRKSELVQLRAEQWLASKVHFPGGAVFSWEVVLSEEISDITSSFVEGRLNVQIPATSALQWMDTEQVAMECFLPLGDGHALHILVEKDFPCKDRPEEDKTDFFTELTEGASVNC